MGNPLSGTEGDCPVFMDRHGMKRQQTEEAIWMSVFVWIIIGAAILGACASGKRKAASDKPYRIDRPHVIDPDDYECSVCKRRLRKDQMVCPYCRVRFSVRVTDDEDFVYEEDELEAWDEEDGIP